MFLVEFAQAHIPSKLLFLALLNILLLIVGCLMDLFSAILVVAPLVIRPRWPSESISRPISARDLPQPTSVSASDARWE